MSRSYAQAFVAQAEEIGAELSRAVRHEKSTCEAELREHARRLCATLGDPRPGLGDDATLAPLLSSHVRGAEPTPRAAGGGARATAGSQTPLFSANRRPAAAAANDDADRDGFSSSSGDSGFSY